MSIAVNDDETGASLGLPPIVLDEGPSAEEKIQWPSDERILDENDIVLRHAEAVHVSRLFDRNGSQNFPPPLAILDPIDVVGTFPRDVRHEIDHLPPLEVIMWVGGGHLATELVCMLEWAKRVERFWAERYSGHALSHGDVGSVDHGDVDASVVGRLGGKERPDP
jgi:hypothetical protein